MTSICGNKSEVGSMCGLDAGHIGDHQSEFESWDNKKRSPSEIGRANRRKGAEKERQVARLMGGKRTPQSGGSVLGGGDLVFPTGSIFADFSWEVKSRKLLPEIVTKALTQAEYEAKKTSGRLRPAAVICPDFQRPVVYFFVEDFVQWAQALAEMGSGAAVKTRIRQMRHALDEMEKLV